LTRAAARSLRRGPIPILAGSDFGVDTALSIYRTLAIRYHADAFDFELSPGYVYQAARHGFGAAVAEENVTLYTRDPVTGRPVIVASVGRDRAERIATVARRLHQSEGRPVVVKNVAPALEPELRRLGLRDYAGGDGWRPWALRDDNTFPEQVFESRRLAELVGRQYRKLRHERNQSLRHHRFDITARGRGGPEPGERERLLTGWATRLGARTGLAPVELLSTVRHLLTVRPGLLHYEARDRETRSLVALFALSPISGRCLAFNALVSDPDYPSSFRIWVISVAALAAGLGYDWLNVQGSEDRAQHLSKRKLRPFVELAKTHLVFAG
jgi:hypothetical protein